MKYYINSLLGLLIGLVVFSCTEDALLEQNGAQTHSIQKIDVVAYTPNNEKTVSRIALTDVTNTEKDPIIAVSWEDEDCFMVLRENSELFSKSGKGNVFSGILPRGEGDYYAIYPYHIGRYVNEIPFDLSIQTGGLDREKTYMSAVSSDGRTYNFKHITALLKLTFNGIPETERIDNVTLMLGVTTKGTIDLTKNNEISGKISTIYFKDKLPEYIYLPPMEQGERMTFTVDTDEQGNKKKYVGTLVAGQNIEPGLLYIAEVIVEEKTEYVWTSSTIASTPKGKGTQEEPYQIETASHLQWMVEISENRNYTKRYYELKNDLIIQSTSDAPWPNLYLDNNKNGMKINEFCFEGYFDGGNHTISGKIVGGSATTGRYGLFGTVYGEIKNLNVNANIQFNSGWALAIGGIAGWGDKFTNCTFRGKVTGKKSAMSGGIVGMCEGSITDCINYGTILGGKTEYMDDCIGGIVGTSESPIENCINYGKVKGGNGIGTSELTGGIAGTSDDLIKNCVNYGNVIGGSGNNSTTGGIVGYANGCIIACINKSQTIAGGVGNYKSFTGGIAGHIFGYCILACANLCENVTSGKSYRDECYTGTLIGYNNTTDCIASWTVGNILIGYLDRPNEFYDGDIIECYKGGFDIINEAVNAMNKIIKEGYNKPDYISYCPFHWEVVAGDYPILVKNSTNSD